MSVAPAARIEVLSTPVQYMKGVGPHRAELLKKLNITTLEDVLFHFPREHQDRHIRSIAEAVAGRKQTFVGRVEAVSFQRVGKMLGHARIVLRDGTGALPVVWFKHLTYKFDVFSGLKRLLVDGQNILVYGLVESGPHGLTLKAEDQEAFTPDQQISAVSHGWVPIYPLTEGVGERWMREMVQRTVAEHAPGYSDPLPESLRRDGEWIPFVDALRWYHKPETQTQRDQARERLAFDEFFFFETALALNRHEHRQQEKSHAIVLHRTLLTPFRAQLGYEFTKAQSRSINEIFRDMQNPFPMNRLLQGDVGSGKTLVAVSAALLAIENKTQVAFLAPTEILATQHFVGLRKLLRDLPVRVELLLGSMPAAERKRKVQRVSSGEVDILVGTHAILGKDVHFKRLGLVVIDEQHRFGVRQREKLVSKGLPDVLIMTATPIPRTLALTLYGDLDVSVIDEMPAGRQPIKTVAATETSALERIGHALKRGEQAYVVFPLVEESEKLSARTGKQIQAATKEYERLRQIFSFAKVGLLHGQMSADEKSRVMDSFRKGEIAVLVATPVIEVGIDVANATTIAVMNPERFGLSQLHQLRGRVGRGAKASECLLVCEYPEEVGERLAIFCAVSDGFKLSEEDLRLRGPGEFLGEAQHGQPFFRVGDLLRDRLLIARARQTAKQLVDGEYALTVKEFANINRVLQKRFGTKLSLSRIG
jgi:ATP-dependent DNA helicase RecG